MPATTALKMYRGDIAIGHKLLNGLFGYVGDMWVEKSQQFNSWRCASEF
jgi:hypothetical protein